MNPKPTNSMIRRCVFIMAIFIIVGFGVLIGFLAYYQIINHEFYESKALQQQTLDTEITAKCGTIYDRNFVELAVSAQVETVTVSPNEIETDEQRQKVAHTLSEILELDYEETYEKVCKKTMYVRIKRQVNATTADKIREQISEKKLKGIHFEEDSKRYYPYSTLASQIIGFRGVDQGLFGVENLYDDYLSGTNGKIITAKNAAGNELPVQYETYVEALNGQDVVLTIDQVVQQYLEKHLEIAKEENNATFAAGIVMDVNSGEVLGMAVEPDFDLNNPYTILDEQMLKELSQLEGEEYDKKEQQLLNSLWRNSLVSDTYMPGSTFKIVTAAMALEEGLVTPETSGFSCGGSATVADRRIGCWKHAGHGHQNFQEAIQNSCNPAFIKLGQSIGSDNFIKYFEAFGLKEKTGIDLLGEASGLFHDPKRFHEVELATAAFGQNFKVTPIAMLNAVCAVANGGNLMTPHVVKQITQTDEDGNIKVVKNISPTVVRQVISAETSDTLCKMLEGVVSAGSGKNAYVKGYRVAGKTGTSEKTDERNESGEVDKYIASFIGFAPADDPQIAILIMIDEPKAGEYFGGLIAAPVAGDVLGDILPYLSIQTEYTKDELATIDIPVPNLNGKESADAIKQLVGNGFKYKLVGGEGKVETQSPGAGEQIPQDGVVVLYTNGKSPTDNCIVPDLTGMSLGTAKNELASAGLNIRVMGNTGTSGMLVYHQEPAKGSKVAAGTVVTVRLKSYQDVSN